MRKFLLKILLYIACSVVCLAVMFAVLPYNADGFMRAQPVKDRLLAERDSNAVVLVGGSNVAFGFNSRLLADSLRMPVVNMGVHAGLGLRFIIDNCDRSLREGDIVVLSPEPNHFFNSLADGNQPLADLVLLRPSEYWGFLTGAQRMAIVNNLSSNLRARLEYNLSRLAPVADNSVYRLSSFNEYGDIAADTVPVSISRRAKLTKPERFNEEFFKYYVATIEHWRERGITVILFPPAMTETAFDNLRPNLDLLNSKLADAGIPYVIPQSAAVMGDEMFFDTDFHTNRNGATERSLQLLNVLRGGK